MDSITLSDLEISCIIGIYPHERTQEQLLFLDITVSLDLMPSAKSDHITDTLDYDNIANKATQLAVKNKYQLIETLANDLNGLILKEHKEVFTSRVTVKKPAAVPKAKFASVTMEKSR